MREWNIPGEAKQDEEQAWKTGMKSKHETRRETRHETRHRRKRCSCEKG